MLVIDNQPQLMTSRRDVGLVGSATMRDFMAMGQTSSLSQCLQGPGSGAAASMPSTGRHAASVGAAGPGPYTTAPIVPGPIMGVVRG